MEEHWLAKMYWQVPAWPSGVVQVAPLLRLLAFTLRVRPVTSLLLLPRISARDFTPLTPTLLLLLLLLLFPNSTD